MKTSPRHHRETHLLRAFVFCHPGHMHEMGVAVATPVPAALRWQPDQSGGFSDELLSCRLPQDLEGLTARELRLHPVESILQGFVLVAA